MRSPWPRLLLALLLLLSAGGRLLAADSIPPIDEVKRSVAENTTMSVEQPSADHPLIATQAPAHDILHLRGATPLVGVLLLALAILPLFFGWRLLRLSLALLSAYFLAVISWEFGMPYLHLLMPSASPTALEPILVVASVVAAVVGFVAGWFLYRLQVATVGAVLAAMVVAIPASYIQQPVLVGILLAITIVLGFIAGWVIAPYWAALQTSILGGILVVQGVLILTQGMMASSTDLVAYAIGISAAIIGFVIQVLWIGHRTLVHGGPVRGRPLVNV